MEETMWRKQIVITTAMLLGTATAVAAQSVPQTAYKDLIRPNGHMRSDAVHQADLDACYRQTGGSRYLPDSAAMKKCMLSRGFRFMWQRGFASGSVRSAPSSAYVDPGPPPEPAQPVVPIPVDPPYVPYTSPLDNPACPNSLC
jgi:hypothetical protein